MTIINFLFLLYLFIVIICVAGMIVMLIIISSTTLLIHMKICRGSVCSILIIILIFLNIIGILDLWKVEHFWCLNLGLSRWVQFDGSGRHALICDFL